jgi:hypothetical protein
VRILHLPLNIASQLYISVKALNSIGEEARGLIVNPSILQEKGDIDFYKLDTFSNKIAAIYPVLSKVYWAEVLHWHFGVSALPKLLDLYWARLLRKPGVIEFWGSDIRIDDIEAQDNPYYKRVREQGHFRLPDSRQESLKTQKLFASAGYECILGDRILLKYIYPGLFNKIHIVPQRIFIQKYQAVYPDPDNKKPVIAHSPSRPLEKGSPTIQAAVEKLREKYDFDFWLITGVERSKALDLVGKCDIFVDQLIAGTHGLAALEAMALGKPVVCYMKPSAVESHPADLPIVNANMDDLEDVLDRLLQDGDKRHELGRQGRAYVEKYHNALDIACKLKNIYQNLQHQADF